jgi:5,6-dimethylbenzimidazole synthase
MPAETCFSMEEREAVYRAIRERRDVRSGFQPEPLSDGLIRKLLGAAHQAPSVGLMQPWHFVLIEKRETRQAVHELFLEANRAASSIYDEERSAAYSKLKLAGILEAPHNLCVLCDATAARGFGLGRQTMPETAIYSAVCAVQNLWLAARAEGVGVGWVSIVEPEKLKHLLRIPPAMTLVAYLCVGYVDRFAEVPELESLHWEQRIPLEAVLHRESFSAAAELLDNQLLGTEILKEQK